MFELCTKLYKYYSIISLYKRKILLPGTQLYSASRKDISSLGHGCNFCRVSSWMSSEQLCLPEQIPSRCIRTSAEQPTWPWSSFIHLPKRMRPNLAECINKTSSEAQVALNFSFEQYSPLTERAKRKRTLSFLYELIQSTDKTCFISLNTCMIIKVIHCEIAKNN